MKAKFKYAQGRAVLDLRNDFATVNDVQKFLDDPNVLSFSVVKETPAQYFKRQAREEKAAQEANNG